MPPDSASENKQPKRQSKESMRNYLWENAEKIKAERDAKKLEELEKENFRTTHISKYQKAISETQDRFIVESKLCEDIFGLIAPTLQEIINFAEQNSTFPREMEKIPDLLPIQIFQDPNVPFIEPKLYSYYSPTNEEIVAEYQSKTTRLMQEHAHLTCGIKWGWITGHTDEGESYGKVYGIELSISHLSEVKLGGILFSVPELSSKEFKKALSDAFYSPVMIDSYYRNPNLPKKLRGEQGSTVPVAKRSTINIATFVRSVKSFWTIIWSEPKFKIDEKTSFLKKLWYGFPAKDKSDDESS